MVHANHSSICFSTGVISDRSFALREYEFFYLCCSCDLDLDPITFIYDLDPYSLEITKCANMNFLREGFRKLSSDRQTYRQTDTQTELAEIII